METRPQPDPEQPIDLIRQVSDEYLRNISPEEAYERTATCVGCFGLSEIAYTPKDIALCQDISVTQARKSLQKMATDVTMRVVAHPGGNFVSRPNRQRVSEVPDNCFRALPPEEKTQRIKQPYSERQHEAMILTCISCIESRRSSTGNTVITPDDLRPCFGLGVTKIGAALSRLALKHPDTFRPIAKPKNAYAVSVANLPNVVIPDLCQKIQPPNRSATAQRETSESNSHRQTSVAGQKNEAAHRKDKTPRQKDEVIRQKIEQCITCHLQRAEPGEEKIAIYATKISECMNITRGRVSGILEQLSRTENPLVTRPARNTIMRPTDYARQIAAEQQPVDCPTSTENHEPADLTPTGRFVTWAQQQLSLLAVDIQPDIPGALDSEYVSIAHHESLQPESDALVDTNGTYLAVGPELAELSEYLQQAVLHVLGLDVLVYGRRLSERRVKQRIGLDQQADLEVYAYTTLLQIRK